MTPDTYYEVIGSVVNSTKLKTRHLIPMGPDLSACSVGLASELNLLTCVQI
jgi:hypothetical protein